MRTVEATVEIATGTKTAFRIERSEDEVTMRHVGPDLADMTTPVHLSWHEFCQLPAAIDKLRVLFGEKTAMDK